MSSIANYNKQEYKYRECEECGWKYLATEESCTKCGCPNDKKIIIKSNKSVNEFKNSDFGIILIVLGVISIIWGLALNYSGISSTDKSYGGDAYTGIQNAASATANNVEEMGKTICYGFKGILIVIGGVIIIKGAYIIKNKNVVNKM